MIKFQSLSAEKSPLAKRPPATTFEFLEYQAEINPERIALILHKDSISFWKFYVDAMRFSFAMGKLGVLPGHMVFISHPNYYLHWLLLIACENVGAISASFDAGEPFDFTSYNADFVVADIDPPGRHPETIFQQINMGWINAVYQQNIHDVYSHPRIVLGEEEPQRLTHSSGTTGGHKAMMLHRGAQEIKLRALWHSSGFSRDTRALAIMTFVVNSAYLQATLCLRLGALVVVAPVVAAIRDHHITYFEILPLTLEKIIRELPSDFVKPQRLSIKVVGAPLTKYLRELSLRLLCTDISGRYATNEVWPIATDMSEEGVGTLFPGVDIKIVDDKGEELPLKQIGNVAVRSATMVKEYFENQEATRKHFQGDWFLTGDLGRLLRSRRLEIIGRSDDVLNKGGVKCYPQPIEEEMRKINGVLDAAVTAVPAEHAIDDLCVAIVLEDGVDGQTLLSHITAAASGWPKVQVKFVTELYKTANGKLSRSAIRQLFR